MGTLIAGRPVMLASWVYGVAARLAMTARSHALVPASVESSPAFISARARVRTGAGVSSSPMRTGGRARVGVSSRS